VLAYFHSAYAQHVASVPGHAETHFTLQVIHKSPEYRDESYMRIK
jgi:hypothetical protein